MVSVLKPLVSVSVLNRRFFTFFHGFEPLVFHGSSLVSRFSDSFSWFRFETIRNRWLRHGFGLKIIELEPNHSSKIDGFGSDKFSLFQFGTATSGYGFDFNRWFGKPWGGLIESICVPFIAFSTTECLFPLHVGSLSISKPQNHIFFLLVKQRPHKNKIT